MSMHLLPREGRLQDVLDLADSSHLELEARPMRVAIVGTYPPTRCGIATYTASLRSSLVSLAGDTMELGVVRVLQDDDDNTHLPDVVGTVRPGDPASVSGAAGTLSSYDLVILQHEFGIYGPDDGCAVVDLMDGVEAPVIVTLHTVTENPSASQYDILRRISSRAAGTVVHTDAARDLLQRVYGMPEEMVVVIPHGADPTLARRFSDAGSGSQPLILTWGLIGPGKGLEWAVMAVGLLRTDYPDIQYLIAGGTHPKIASKQGESYRNAVTELVDRLDLGHNVTMLDRYLEDSELADLIGRTSVVVLPYDSTQQTTSGVLAEAVTWGVPVVATAFPHALEMERLGAARTVPHRDPMAMADMIRRILSDDSLVSSMVAAQREVALSSSWTQVGLRYLDLAESIVTSVVR